MRLRAALTPFVPVGGARAAIGRSAGHRGRACLAQAGGPAFGPARAFRGPPVVAAGLAHRPAFLGRDIAAADAEAGRAAFGTTAAATLAVGQARGFGIAPRLALGSRPRVTGAGGGETPFGAGPALGTLRERRRPAALDAEARGLALGVLPAAAFAVGPSPGFGIANRLALGPEAGGAGAIGGPGLLATGRADAAPGRGRALAAPDAQAALPAFGNPPVVARQVALPPPGGDPIGHDGLLPANPETDRGRPAACPGPRAGDTGPAGRPREEGFSPSACGRRGGPWPPNPRAVRRPAS